jgi:hypothetical protein
MSLQDYLQLQNNRSTTITVTSHIQKRLVKKIFFDKSTNRQKDLEFLEDVDVFVIEVTPVHPNSRIKYEIYNDNVGNQSISKGVVCTTSLNKNIVIVSQPDKTSEYFILLQVYNENEELLETHHKFISGSKVEKMNTDRQKTHDANTKYLSENSNNLEEIIEYTSYTQAFGTLIGPTNDLLSMFNTQNSE